MPVSAKCGGHVTNQLVSKKGYLGIPQMFIMNHWNVVLKHLLFFPLFCSVKPSVLYSQGLFAKYKTIYQYRLLPTITCVCIYVINFFYIQHLMFHSLKVWISILLHEIPYLLYEQYSLLLIPPQHVEDQLASLIESCLALFATSIHVFSIHHESKILIITLGIPVKDVFLFLKWFNKEKRQIVYCFNVIVCCSIDCVLCLWWCHCCFSVFTSCSISYYVPCGV